MRPHRKKKAGHGWRDAEETQELQIMIQGDVGAGGTK
jgi:hypothetical protein